MYYVQLEKMLDKSCESVYKLVVMASKRALELAEGQQKLIENVSPAVKPSIVALAEITEGKIKAAKCAAK